MSASRPGDTSRATPGVLYLVPNLLGAVEPASVLPARTIEVARSLERWIVETPKAARAFLKTIGHRRPIAELAITALPPYASDADLDALLAPAAAGESLGLVSDAGCPAVADPGAALVAAAHRRGVRVVPLVGPSAVLLALMASGMSGQAFTFHGYLPVAEAERAIRLRAIEADSAKSGRTQVFIETPYRNAAMIVALASALEPETRVAVAADLTLPTESVTVRQAKRWRDGDPAAWNRRPAIFVLDASRLGKRRR